MNIHLERGKLLMSQNRPQEAEVHFKQALSLDPNDGHAMTWLAECYLHSRRFPEALELSKQAMSLSPDFYLVRYTLARAYFYNQQPAEAKGIVYQALADNPNDADFFLLLSQIAFHERKWETALEAAEQGLEIAPEQVALINLRAQALIKLNRQAEAAQTMDYALSQAPEDSYSHANRGWVALEQGQYKAAQLSFAEALRLSPDSEFARTGLKEAIKGQNIFYRGILKYFLWMAKMSERNGWAFIIGAYILYRILVGLASKVPALGPLLYPLIAFYVFFAFSSWIAMPVSNLFLRLHPIGKHALNDDERLGSSLAGGLMATAMLAFVGFWATGAAQLLFLGIILGLLLIPAGGAFIVGADTKARRYLSLYGLILGAIGIAGALLPAAGSVLLLVFGLGIFAYSWVANYLIGQDAKSF